MALIKDGKAVDDRWTTVEGDDALPADTPAIVRLARWRAERDRLVGRNAPLGVRLASDEAPEEIADDLGRFGVIALEFPSFTDGRAYSSARILRERYRFAGELRAVGNVLRDQIPFMARCGFDAFEMGNGDANSAAREWRSAMDRIKLFYQPAADGRSPVSVLRRGDLPRPLG